MAKVKKVYIVDDQGWYLERTDLGYWFSPEKNMARMYTEEEAYEIINSVSHPLKTVAA